jgi:hypothetical protein
LVKSDGFDNVCGVWSDTSGYYEIFLPERTYNCFYVNDGNYRSTSLEAWAWHIIVEEDQRLDFSIGTGEVYNMHVWPNNGGSSTFFISFRPMVLWHTNSTDDKRLINDKEFKLVNISPDLGINDLSVTINGKQTEISSIQMYYETGTDWAMPAYLIQVRRLMPCFGKQTIQVRYEKTIEKEGKMVTQSSMGYFQFYPNYFGLSDFN